jgi:hypothetical protein
MLWSTPGVFGLAEVVKSLEFDTFMSRRICAYFVLFNLVLYLSSKHYTSSELFLANSLVVPLSNRL